MEKIDLTHAFETKGGSIICPLYGSKISQSKFLKRFCSLGIDTDCVSYVGELLLSAKHYMKS